MNADAHFQDTAVSFSDLRPVHAPPPRTYDGRGLLIAAILLTLSAGGMGFLAGLFAGGL